MFKTILLTLSIALSSVAMAQSDVYLKTDYIPVKIKLPPAIKEISSSVKYVIVSPEKLKYHGTTSEVEKINWLGRNLNLEGKKVLKKADADYVLELSTDGISISDAAPQAYAGGYVYNFKCYFPVTLNVINKQGTVEKTFRFNTDSLTWTYHFNFLLDPFTTEDWNPRKKVVPFVNADSAANALLRSKQDVYKRIEFNAWYYTMEFAKKVLSLSYNSTQLTPSTYYYNFTNKAGIEANKEVTEWIKKQMELVKKLSDIKTYNANIEVLRSGQAYIDGVIGNISSAPLSYQKMVLSSAALSTLFAGDYAKAADYFLRYFRIENENKSDLFWSFRSAYNDVRNWSIARSQELVVSPIESVDFLYVK